MKNLLQRLLLPPGSDAFSGIGTFRGLSKETLNYLFTICDFDYMGASQYEWGAIPKSLSNIFKSRQQRIYIEKEISGVNFIFLVEKEKSEEYFKKVETWMETNRDAHGEYHGLADWKGGGYLNIKNLTGWLDLTDDVLFFVNNEQGKEMAQKFKEFLCP